MYWTSIEERESAGVVVLCLRGHMSLGTDERTLLARIRQLLSEGSRFFVLDLEAVSFVDSVGLGEIVRAYSMVMRAGGALVLCNVASRVRGVLEATQLSRVLQTFGSEPEAIVGVGASVR
jgi:anti-sigma B factor antagonist